jgi:hypothetical protein
MYIKANADFEIKLPHSRKPALSDYCSPGEAAPNTVAANPGSGEVNSPSNPPQKVRAYHFLSSRYAIDDLRHRRLKISLLDDLNDPFDLWAVAQPDRRLRKGIRELKKDISRRFGMVCFSLSWQNPQWQCSPRA